MKKLHFILIIFSCLAISFLSSCREGLVEPIRKLELYVVDTLGMPVSNAKVDFYFTEQDLKTATNQIIESLYTDEKGGIKVALDLETFDYYVNIEKEGLNNWYTNTFINLPNLFEKNSVTVLINTPFEAKLTGKYRRRWQQTEDIINSNPSLPNCGNQLYHDFIRRIETEKDKRSGEVERYQTNICPFPGALEGINQWVYDKQNNTITFGIGNFAETYKITEFTGDRMSLVYTTPDGAFVKEKRYKTVE